jgi:hypothetical protein
MVQTSLENFDLDMFPEGRVWVRGGGGVRVRADRSFEGIIVFGMG